MDTNTDSFLTSSEDAFAYAQALFGEITEPAPLVFSNLDDGFKPNHDTDWLTSAMGNMSPFLPTAELSSFPGVTPFSTSDTHDLGCPCPPQLRIEMEDLTPTPELIPSPREADITPEELEELRPLIIQRQKEIMKPLLKRAGRRRKNDLPHGTMVFQLPSRSLKRVKQIEQTQGPSCRTPRGKACLLCSMRRVKIRIIYLLKTSSLRAK
ncbi:hypothetical protein H072_7760 [Dactylellina haptotyla CBS 200.50]|uniref:Uncharacterized protein n=1 Tax=Dactylellina haptotyla (strain CBS 200.50) TaxID=1284197 RepID=S8BGR0_DACHA|nr:hypothetical protein H072_7760 [Dactylellina haptotyla CBS 200.50]